MLYLIGGAARAGKSTLARDMLLQDRIPYNSLDYITSLFHYGAPELGISHDQSPLERGKRLWPRIEAVLKIYTEEEPAYLIDGEAFLPNHVAAFLETVPGVARACFFGYADADPDKKFYAIRAKPGVINDWTRSIDDETVRYLVQESINFSRYIRDECAKYNLAYFDTSQDFDDQIEAARNYLLQP